MTFFTIKLLFSLKIALYYAISIYVILMENFKLLNRIIFIHFNL